MDSSQRLTDWLRALLDIFANVDERDRKALSGTLEDICPPCQVDVVWFAVPDLKVSCQAFIFSRFADMQHGLITVHGPAHPSQDSEILRRLVSHPKWERPVTGRSIFALRDPSYPRLLEVPIHQVLAHIKGAVLTRTFGQPAEPTKPRRGSAGRLSDDAFYWICEGNLAERSAEDMAKDILEEARERAVSAKRTAERPAQVEPVTEPGFGTYLYPPVWVGQLPTETTEQRLHKSFQDRFLMGVGLLADEALTCPYKSRQLVVMQNGFVAINESDRQEALRKLNELIAALLLSGLPSYAIRDHELSEVGFQDDRIARRTEPITSMRMAWGTGSLAGFETIESLEWTRTMLSSEDLRQVLTSAEKVNSVDVPSVLFLLESYTAFQDSEFPQSYIMSWAVIEDWIVAKWEAFLKTGRGVSGKRLKKLTESHLAWTVDHYLEALNLAEELSDERYDSLMTLKSKRNNMLHERRVPTKGDAARALDAATTLLRELLPFPIEPSLAKKARS